MEKDALLTAPEGNPVRARPSLRPQFQQTRGTRVMEITGLGAEDSGLGLSSDLTWPGDFRSK